MINKTFVILVDENDNAVGVMEKLIAHQNAHLHRAVSIFITNTHGDWILQRRALNKYHSSGLWSNTCCSHPYPGETSLDAASRRLVEEMGIHCPLIKIFSYLYKELLDNDLTEFELDHIFVGVTDEFPKINTDEVLEWKAISVSELNSDINTNPELFTVWFKKLYWKLNGYAENIPHLFPYMQKTV